MPYVGQQGVLVYYCDIPGRMDWMKFHQRCACFNWFFSTLLINLFLSYSKNRDHWKIHHKGSEDVPMGAGSCDKVVHPRAQDWVHFIWSWPNLGHHCCRGRRSSVYDTHRTYTTKRRSSTQRMQKGVRAGAESVQQSMGIWHLWRHHVHWAPIGLGYNRAHPQHMGPVIHVDHIVLHHHTFSPFEPVDTGLGGLARRGGEGKGDAQEGGEGEVGARYRYCTLGGTCCGLSAWHFAPIFNFVIAATAAASCAHEHAFSQKLEGASVRTYGHAECDWGEGAAYMMELHWAKWVQSAMILDALRQVCDTLDYLHLLKNQLVFDFRAIPASMAFATLDLKRSQSLSWPRHNNLRNHPHPLPSPFLSTIPPHHGFFHPFPSEAANCYRRRGWCNWIIHLMTDLTTLPSQSPQQLPTISLTHIYSSLTFALSLHILHPALFMPCPSPLCPHFSNVPCFSLQN